MSAKKSSIQDQIIKALGGLKGTPSAQDISKHVTANNKGTKAAAVAAALKRLENEGKLIKATTTYALVKQAPAASPKKSPAKAPSKSPTKASAKKSPAKAPAKSPAKTPARSAKKSPAKKSPAKKSARKSPAAKTPAKTPRKTSPRKSARKSVPTPKAAAAASPEIGCWRRLAHDE